MGVIQVPGERSGQLYSIQIDGDVPTNTEYARIADYVKQQEDAFAQRYEQSFGEVLEEDDGTAIGRGFERGKKQIKQAFGETLGTIGEKSGLEALATYGQGLEERARQELGELQIQQPERMQSTDVDSIGSALRYAGEVVGEQIPQLGLGLGAAIAAPVVVPATTALGSFAVGATAAAGVTAPILFGNNIQRQEDEVAAGKKASVDVGDALIATFGQATLEGIADKILLGGAFRSLGKSIFTRTASRVGSGATTEGLTEVGQQMMERAQAGLSIDSEDAIAEYREAAIAGGLIGGGTRATIGPFGERDSETTETTETDDTTRGQEDNVGQDTQTAPPVEPEQLELDLDDPLLRPQLREGQEQGELFTAASEYNPAEEKEAQNKDDPNYKKGKAEQTEKQRAAAAAAAAGVTSDAALENDQTNLFNEEVRKKEKAAAKAKNKTNEYLKDKTQESGAAAIKSEQTGKNIEVGKKSVETTETTEEAFTPNFVKNVLGIQRPRAPLLLAATEGDLSGKSLNDPVVVDRLSKYVNRRGAESNAVLTSMRERGYEYDGKQFVRLESEGVGTSDADSGSGVAGTEGAGGRNTDTEGAVSPNTGGVGTDLSDTESSDVAERKQSGALTDEEAQYIRQNPLSAEAQAEAEKRRLIRETPGGYAALVRNALAETGTTISPEVLVEQDELDARKAKLAEEQRGGLAVPTGPMTGAIGGAETEADANFVPVPAPVEVPDAPPVRGASVSQEQLQAMEAQQDAAAQARIDKIFESNRGKQPQRREYHDTQVDPRSAPEVTTAVDKEAIAELLETSDTNLKGDANASARAAKLFFKRFRRPVDALAEIGAVRADGPTQSIEKDYTPVQFAFYDGMTQNSAIQASLWVNNNLSRQARNEVRDAKIAARIDPNDNRRDAYLGVVKAAQAVIASDARKVRRQLAKQEKGTAETARKREVKKQLDKSVEVPLVLNAPKPIRLRSGQEVYRITTPQKGLSTIEANLVEKGFKRRKVRKNETVPEDAYTLLDEKDGAEILYVYQDTRNKNELLTKEYHKEIVEDLEYTLETYDMLLIDPVKGLDQKLLPSIQNALQRGDLQFAVDAIATTSRVKRIREIAAKLGNVVGSTQIQVVDDLSPLAGRRAAGLFSPEQNTIYIDANNGMNVHTILHEMTHAATSASIAANPSLPEVKQLQTILENIRKQFGEVYGTANLDEFVAEAFSNPEFQSALALSKVDGGKTSNWERFTAAIKRAVRRILGLSPSPNALSEVDRLVEGLLAPAPATRAAPNMLMAADNKKGAAGLVQNIANVVPESGKDKIADLSSVVFDEGVGKTAKSWTLNTLPVNILTDIASKRIPFAKQLNMLINKQSGALRQRSEVLDSILNNLHAWQRKNKELAKVLNNIPRSTFLKVDPSRSDPKYMKTIRDDKERSAEYDQLRAEYDKLDDAGKAFYRQMRNYFQDTYDDIIAALDARLEATIPDAEVKQNAFEKLRQLLQKDTGVIRPYFPLQRKGNYRLAYTAPDPDSGRPELFVEYYPTLRKAEQARAKIIGVDAEAAITDANTIMDFRKVPNTGFVRDILVTLQFSQDKFNSDENYRKVMQEIVDLSLDAMPERSFMQNFRRRKGVRGFIGDTTPTGMGAMDFDAYTMLKEKGRDLNRQLVQLRSAAEIEKFRKDLAPYKTDPSTAMIAQKLDQIADFAQSPNVPRVSQVINSLGFGMTMGLNFSSAAITFFDVAMSAMPILAGTHKLGPTSRAFGTATKLFLGAPSKRTIMATGPDGELVPQEVNMGMAGKSISNYDLNSLPKMLKDIRADILIKMGVDQGQFNQSMTQENLEIGRDAPLETFNKYSSFMFHHSERFNRETTLTAAYMLEVNKMRREKGQLTDADYEKAAQEAIDTTEFTLGATAAAGRPIVAQKGIGNILFLFKRFAISKYYMMAKLAQESAAGNKAAQAATRNFLISTGIFAGLGGMPLMGGIGAMYNLFAEDDEDDFEAATRKLVGEGIYGGLANEILGVDLANRISMNSLLYRAPLIDKDQSNLWTLIEQLGGPVIGVGLSIERGMKDIYEGEVQRGIEAMAPAAVRNGLKSFRFATEGAETRRGDPVTEDINPYNVVMQGLGFAPQGYIQQLEVNKNVRRREDAVNSRRTKLLRRRNMAIREGDIDELEKVERLIDEYNASLPQDADTRKKRITSDTKQSSLRTFDRTTGDMRGGITTTDFSRSILEQYDLN